MKSRTTFFSIIVCLFLCTFLISIFSSFALSTSPSNKTSSSSKKILIVTGEYPPLVSKQLDNYGLISNVVIAVLKDMGVPYEIKFYPWARCEQMVLSGEAFATYPFAQNDDRLKNFLFSDSIFTSNDKYFYLKDNNHLTPEFYNYNTLSSFKNYIFGGQNGYWYGSKEDFTKLGIKSEWASSTESLIKMLYNRRIDFFINEYEVSNYLINKLYPHATDKFATLSNSANVHFSYLMSSKNYPASKSLLQRFNTSLSKLKSSGIIDKILSKK